MAACQGCAGCMKPTCESGLFGLTCEKACEPNCRVIACASCDCDVCNRISGACLNGCDAGWYGETCTDICPPNCFQKRLISVQCEQYTGTCKFGCAVGYYGDTCNVTCTSNCLKSMCDQSSGLCSQGCQHGFEGDFCNEESGGLGGDQIAGAVGGAFVVILWGIVVIILICVIWRRRLKDYEVFNRNQLINNRPTRGSSRRRLHRKTSNSSNCGAAMLSPGCEYRHDHHGRVQETTIGRDHDSDRVITYRVDTPVHCEHMTSHSDIMTSHADECNAHMDDLNYNVEVAFGELYVPDDSNRPNITSAIDEPIDDLEEDIWRVRRH